MRIGIVAPVWIPVPPEGYGGIEVVVSLLTEELVARGHDVTLFASGDSRTKATLRSAYDVAPTERIWEVIADAHHMPRWWPGVTRMEGVESDRFTHAGVGYSQDPGPTGEYPETHFWAMAFLRR